MVNQPRFAASGRSMLMPFGGSSDACGQSVAPAESHACDGRYHIPARVECQWKRPHKYMTPTAETFRLNLKPERRGQSERPSAAAWQARIFMRPLPARSRPGSTQRDRAARRERGDNGLCGLDEP